MAYTTTDLESINRAIASGSLSVAFGDRSRTYRSMSELREARDIIKGDLEAANGRRRPMGFRTSTRKALGW